MAVFNFLFKSDHRDPEPENRPKEFQEAENGEIPSPQPGTVEMDQASTKPSSEVTEPVASGAPQASPTKPSTDTSSPDIKVTDSAPSNSQVQRSSPRGFSSFAVFFKRQVRVPGPDQRAKESALVVRSLIVGTVSVSSGATQTVSKPELNKVKSQLMQPKAANKMIAQLRALPVFDGNAAGNGEKANVLQAEPAGPIHAVCLATTDKEVEERHFSQLAKGVDGEQSCNIPSVSSASIEKLTKMFKDMNIVSLVKSPDFGLGQPGDGDGILSGAVPTAETVINGVEQFTPQLMALAFSNSVWPDHKGVYPPTDRMSVLTYWWGLELVLPDSSIQYLSTVQSITQTVMNFLTALSVMANGVREILPFIRYISQFVDLEFSLIKKQNRGQGVVCAATWIMPAAMVPRPWDFAIPPPKPVQEDSNDKDEFPVTSTDLPRTSQGTWSTEHPRPSNVTAQSESTFGPIPSLPPVLPEVVINTPNVTSNSVLV